MAEQTAASAPFRQVDPLIAAPPTAVAAERFSLPPIGFRPDIEGLRAIAVVLVVLFHADIGPFGGGFIGVDVFFVVSGFLITSLLLGEVSRTGTVSLPNFWARRARRLIPASCLVVAATLIAAQWLYDPLLLGDLAREAIAVCGFFVNYVFAWREAHGDGGYFDADIAKSPLLHFWSLAVEEQFYLLWPLVIWTLARFARRLRHELTIVILGLWVLSAAACVWLTGNNTPWAFYSLASRAWELLTGALLAISIATLRNLPRRFVVPMATAGLLVVIVAAMVFDAGTPFPGYAAAGAGLRHRARDRGGLQRPGAGRRAGGPRRPVDVVDRAAFVRHLPVALAGARARRRDVGSAVSRPTTGRGRRLGGPRCRLVPPRREPGPPLTVDGVASQSQPRHRLLVAARDLARRRADARQPPRAERGR